MGNLALQRWPGGYKCLCYKPDNRSQIPRTNKARYISTSTPNPSAPWEVGGGKGRIPAGIFIIVLSLSNDLSRLELLMVLI